MSERSLPVGVVAEPLASDHGAPEIPRATLRQVMAQYPTGVTVITSRDELGSPRGLLVGTFLRVSDSPELVGFMAMHSSRSGQATRSTLEQFCVNIVSDHQGDMCRAITNSSGRDFSEVPHSTSQGGNPAIHGAIAHIDCTVERITALGDHDFVVGRVEHAQLVSAAHPMVYFRGGYGRFASGSRTAKDHGFRAQLAEIDLCRGEMEALAAETGCEVTINAIDEDETVVVAAAGRVGPGALRVRVGQRLPFAAPFGSIEAAFGSETLRQRWLESDTTTSKSRVENLAVIDAVRARGYAIAYGHTAHGRIVSTAQQLAKADPARRAELIAQLNGFDQDYNRAPGTGSGAGAVSGSAPAAGIELRSVVAPIYGADGLLAYGLTLWAPAHSIDGAEVSRLIDAALRCAERCSGIVGG